MQIESKPGFFHSEIQQLTPIASFFAMMHVSSLTACVSSHPMTPARCQLTTNAVHAACRILKVLSKNTRESTAVRDSGTRTSVSASTHCIPLANALQRVFNNMFFQFVLPLIMSRHDLSH